MAPSAKYHVVAGPFLLYYLFENPGMTPATVTIQ